MPFKCYLFLLFYTGKGLSRFYTLSGKQQNTTMIISIPNKNPEWLCQHKTHSSKKRPGNFYKFNWKENILKSYISMLDILFSSSRYILCPGQWNHTNNFQYWTLTYLNFTRTSQKGTNASHWVNRDVWKAFIFGRVWKTHSEPVC